MEDIEPSISVAHTFAHDINDDNLYLIFSDDSYIMNSCLLS